MQNYSEIIHNSTAMMLLTRFINRKI